MKLYLLRHADAGEPLDPKFYDDSRRPITAKGIKRTKQLSKWFRRSDISFDLILASPYTRARQTAEVVANELGIERKLKISRFLAPDGNFKAVIDEVEGKLPPKKNVLLIGHMPSLAQFASWLFAGSITTNLDIKKGGLCRLEVEGGGEFRTARLEWLLTPRHLGSRASA